MRGRPRKLEDEGKVRQVKVRFPGYFYEGRRAPHVTLILGRYAVGDDNPGGVKASRCLGCRSHFKAPKLLLKHHSQPYELWYCLGCENVLIKAKVKDTITQHNHLFGKE